MNHADDEAAVAVEPDASAAGFAEFDRDLDGPDPGAAVGRLVARLEARDEPRALLDALILKARVDLGLPPIPDRPSSELPEPTRSAYEGRYVDAIRAVGGRLLDAGQIGAAWPYFRAIGEKDAVAAAIDRLGDPLDPDHASEVIEVAFHQGAHPRRGWELILDHYGACSAITAYEHLPADEPTRAPCSDRLVRHIHDQIVANLGAEVRRRGLPAPSDSIAEILAEHPALMDEEAYHVDTSHLAATVRSSPILVDPGTIALAIDLTRYGSALAEVHKYEGDPPFESTYEDHAVYLNALIGREVDRAVDHFSAKLTPPDQGDPIPAQVLVRLLLRLGRVDRALDVAAEHLAGLPEGVLIVPTVAQIGLRAGRADRLATIARGRGDLVGYAAARLLGGAASP